MLCDFQTIDDHRRRCQRCGTVIQVRGHRGRAVWAECQAIDLGSPAAGRPCSHLGPEIGREPCGTCSGHVELKVYRCLHPRHETTTLADCRRCGDYAPLATPGASTRSMFLHFPHGFGDVVQLTTVLLHLRQLYPQWAVDVAVRPGTETMLRGLCRRAYALGDEPPDSPGGPYDVRRTLWFHEADATYADSPATKAEKALREVFQIQPQEELCRYQASIDEVARQRAAAYCAELAAAGGFAAPVAGRYVLIHYQGNTSRQNKNLDERAVAALCEEIIARGCIPVILDWDRRSGLVDQRRVFCPGVEHPLWGGRGHGDGATLAALAEQAAWCVGIDSGPGHLFGATATPTLIVWTKHHPLHYFGLSDTVTHLVPVQHQDLLRGDRDLGLRYFESKYQHRIYGDLARSLVLLAREFLARAASGRRQPASGGRQPTEEPTRDFFSQPADAGRSTAESLSPAGWMVDGDHWVRRAHRAADMVIVRDAYFDDCYGVAELPSVPQYVIDVGAHIGTFALRLRRRSERAQIACVEANPANRETLEANVGDFATVIAAACTYEPGDVGLLSTVFDGSHNTGGSTVMPMDTPAWRERATGREYQPTGRVPKVTLEEIARAWGWPRIDLLKLDCEGSEISILQHCDLSLLRFVVGEYHERPDFDALIRRRFANWNLRIVRDGHLGLFWLWPRDPASRIRGAASDAIRVIP